jgi:hypothetical protein
MKKINLVYKSSGLALEPTILQCLPDELLFLAFAIFVFFLKFSIASLMVTLQGRNM